MWQIEWPLLHMLCALNFSYCCINFYGWQVQQLLWQMLSHILMNHVGRHYAKVADGIVTIVNGWCYFNLSSEVLNRTSSQMWGRWYLPVFLFRDRLFTIMYIDSLVVLAMYWSLPPYNAKAINGCFMTFGVTMIKWGGLQIFLEPFPQCSWGFTKVLIITIHPATTEPVYHPTFWWWGLCTWEPPEGLWWSDLLYRSLVLHVFHILSWNFHSVLKYMGQLCEHFSSYTQV